MGRGTYMAHECNQVATDLTTYASYLPLALFRLPTTWSVQVTYHLTWSDYLQLDMCKLLTTLLVQATYHLTCAASHVTP